MFYFYPTLFEMLLACKLLLSRKCCQTCYLSRQAAELSEGLGGSATQQAIVHAFLKDHGRVQCA